MSREYDDELFSFEDEALTAEAPHPTLTWQVLIVDDDLDVHQSTCFAMANTEVLGRSLEFLHAYSAADAMRILRAQPQIAVILLDVVMESDDAGLHLVRSIRQDLPTTDARILLRTA